MTKTLNTKIGMKGWTEKRLFNTPKFIELLNKLGVNYVETNKTINPLLEAYDKAIAFGISKEQVGRLLDKSAKPMFSGNALWKVIRKHLGLDLQIPLLFGMWTRNAVISNTITDVGKKIAADQTGGTTTAPVTAIAIGVGTPSTTALGSESTTNGGSRGAATVSNQTGDTTGDTERWVKTFTFTGSLALTEEGLFDNNTSGGNMLASQTFSAVNVVNTDTFQVTHNVKFA
jgi:hypothetical protein